ncbi:hypothetical protein A1395_21625 [Pseudomonas protegens]|nr:hypothetical protein A1395_21625 [Pseudomonas protegens]
MVECPLDRVKADQGCAGERAQILRPYPLKQRVGQLRERGIKGQVQACSEKGETFNQALDIFVDAPGAEERSKRWIPGDQRPAESTQAVHFLEE